MFNPFRKKPTELETATAALQALQDARALKEAQNAISYETSRLEQLQAQGMPFWSPPRAAAEPRTLSVPIPVYNQDAVTGYPFVPALHYEQITIPPDLRFENDPLFGWLQDPFAPFVDFTPNNGLNSFPRELFPQFAQTLRTQIAFDAVRWESRRFWETLPVYNGLIGHLKNYVVGTGMAIEITGDDETLTQEVDDYIQAFAKYRYNELYARIWDSVLCLFRDGEDFLRLYPTGDLPLLRTVDAGWVRGAHQEITGPFSMGILTRWPEDNQEPLMYHLWLPDNTHYDVPPTQMSHCRLDSGVGGNTKRGIPLSYRMRKPLLQLQKLVDCLAVGEAARQAIPYIQSFELADRATVQGVINSRTPPAWHGGARGPHGKEIEPGEIQYINAGQKYLPPPEGHADSGEVAYNVICQLIAQAANVPIWMVTASVREETRSNALTAEAPVVRMIMHVQESVCAHYKRILSAAVAMGAAQGRFSPDVLEKIDICCSLPSPISRDLQQEITAYMSLTNKGVCAPQTLAARFDLDYSTQRELIEVAEAGGWQNVPENQQLSERPKGEEAVSAAEAQ